MSIITIGTPKMVSLILGNPQHVILATVLDTKSTAPIYLLVVALQAIKTSEERLQHYKSMCQIIGYVVFSASSASAGEVWDY